MSTALSNTYIVTKSGTLLPVPNIVSWDTDHFGSWEAPRYSTISATTADDTTHLVWRGQETPDEDVKAALLDLLTRLHKRSRVDDPTDPLFLSIIDSNGTPKVQSSLTF